MLDRAAAAGLPVPPGWVLVELPAAGPGAHDLVGRIGLSRPDRTFAVRSAFSGEDGDVTSGAGRFHTELGVAVDTVALTDAISRVWASGATHGGARSVIVMRMVAARHAGVAFTETAHEDDLVNWTPGLGDALVSGATPGEQLSLPKLRRGERAALDGPPFAARLARLLRGVRGVFGAGDWDVEWADDGTVSWLLQVRPITRAPRRDETFTIANHKEILPPLPSRFMTSMIASCSTELLEWFRQFDPDIPTSRPLIEVFRGRPMLNLSLLVDMTRVWGMPSRLVTDSLGGSAHLEAGLRSGRLARAAPRLARMGIAQARAATATARTEAEILARTADPGADTAACIETLRWEYVTLVNEMAALTSAASVPVSILRRLGTLEQHAARQRTAATAMGDDLDELRRLGAGDPAARALLAAGRLPEGPTWEAAWARWSDRHGHRGVFESDIARPRFREQPAAILPMAARPSPGRTSAPTRTLLGVITLPLWWQARRPMAARERLRSTAMIGFGRIRDRLLELSPVGADIWDLDIDEARALDAAPLPEGLLERRRAEIAADAAVDLPDLVTRFQDLDAPGPDAPAGGRLTGISLTTGTIEGRAWVLAEPAASPPPDLAGAAIILVARSVDPGWLATFAQVVGVVVETGGDLSHGSIILREIGLPAVTNVHGATRAFVTGDPLRLDASRGLVSRADVTPGATHRV